MLLPLCVVDPILPVLSLVRPHGLLSVKNDLTRPMPFRQKN